ncbi:MAG: Tm-1-like ATP-binding domain-containing protein [Vulcanisaeta sp.]
MSIKKPVIAILVTLDTKEAEGYFLRERINAYGGTPLLVDLSMRRYTPKLGKPDASNEEVAQAAGFSMDQVNNMDRAKAQEVMAKGAIKILKERLSRGELHGVVGLGGTTGLSLNAMIMSELPLYMPKFIVTTAPEEGSRLVSGTDITLFWSITDIAGGERVNTIEAEVLNRVAAAIVAAANPLPYSIEKKPIIFATQFGNTTPHIIVAKDYLSKQGYDVVAFHALGKTGGYTMERLLEAGMAVGVLDVTTHELVDEVAGGVLSASFGDKLRLTTAGLLGIPQVVLPGAVDMINFWGPETVSEKFRERCVYEHSRGVVTLIRATGDELYMVGKLMAERLNKSKGPVLIIFPLRGFSIIDNDPNAKPRPGAYCQRMVRKDGGYVFESTNKPWFDRQADLQLLRALLEYLDLSKPNIDLLVVDYNINDPEIATLTAKVIDEMIKGKWRKGYYPYLTEVIDPNRIVKDPKTLFKGV